MDTHQNARLTPKGRDEMVRTVVNQGLSGSEVRTTLRHALMRTSQPKGH